MGMARVGNRHGVRSGDRNCQPLIRSVTARKGIDLKRLAHKLDRESIGRKYLDVLDSNRTQGHFEYWDTDYSAYGSIMEEPMSALAQIGTRKLTAAQNVIPSLITKNWMAPKLRQV